MHDFQISARKLQNGMGSKNVFVCSIHNKREWYPLNINDQIKDDFVLSQVKLLKRNTKYKNTLHKISPLFTGSRDISPEPKHFHAIM